MREANLIALLSCLPLLACGPRQETRHPKSNDDEAKPALEEYDDGGKDEAQTEQETAKSSEPEPAKAAPETPSSTASIDEVCKKLNRRVTQKCSKKIAELYDSSCKHYLKTPGRCEKEIIAALECQYQASEDALCAHEADQKCLPASRELKACQSGTVRAEQTTAEDTTVPSEWNQVRDDRLGFTVAMPPGAELDAKSKLRTWRAEENGVAYFVAALEPPAGKLNNPTYVRTVVAYVGAQCQRRLKLNGELEIKGTTVVQYHSACPDGSEWHGMLHFWNGKLVSTGYHAPAGATGVQEPFFYSFQIGK